MGIFAMPVPRLLLRLAYLTLLWLCLTGAATDSWPVGIPAILVAAVVGHWLAPGSFGIRWRAVPSFLFFFIREMIRGGFQTAGFALWPGRALKPGLITLPLLLSGSASRTFFINTLNLVPGTLCVGYHGNTVELHVLDVSDAMVEEARKLERQVARMFGDRGAC